MRFSRRTLLEVAAASGILLGTGLITWAQTPFCVIANSPIPDPPSPGIDSDLVIVPDFIFTDLEVTIEVSHSWPGDVVITLAKVAGPDAPAGPITILQRPGVPASTFGCSVDNINTRLVDFGPVSVNTVCRPTPPGVDTGPYQSAPDNVSVFHGVHSQGTWRLHVSDLAGGDTGTLNVWCLRELPIAVELMQFSIE